MTYILHCKINCTSDSVNPFMNTKLSCFLFGFPYCFPTSTFIEQQHS